MNDIYQITGRMKNIIASSGISLSPAGTILLNTYALTVASLYDFADTLPEESRQALRTLLASKEDLPCYVIKLTSPKPQATIGQEVEKKKVQFDSTEKAMDSFQKEYEDLGDMYGISPDELWSRAENAPMLDEDCVKVMRLRRCIDMCAYLIKKEAGRCEHGVYGTDCYDCYDPEHGKN